MTTVDDRPAHVRDTHVRVMRVLMAGAVVNSIVMAVPGPMIGLMAERLTGSATRAGLAQAMFTWGGVLASIPLASLSRRRGRRPAIGLGYLAGSPRRTSARGSAGAGRSARSPGYPRSARPSAPRLPASPTGWRPAASCRHSPRRSCWSRPGWRPAACSF